MLADWIDKGLHICIPYWSNEIKKTNDALKKHTRKEIETNNAQDEDVSLLQGTVKHLWQIFEWHRRAGEKDIIEAFKSGRNIER